MKGELTVETIRDGKTTVHYKKVVKPYFTWGENKPALYLSLNDNDETFVSLNIPIGEVIAELFNSKNTSE